MTTETFQQTFTTSIAQLIFDAYNRGVLQYHPMTVADITIEMTMFRNFNQIALRYNGRMLSVSMYDEDSEYAQLSSIESLLADILS